MPTNRRRRLHVRRALSQQWHQVFLETGERTGEHVLEVLRLESDYLHGGHKLRRLWQHVRGPVLAGWERRHPGTRPWAWWLFDAPRGTPPAELPGWARDRDIDCRRVVAGRGRPLIERCPHVVPRYRLGAPVDFVDVDPMDPPRLESQAAYLRRHGLLTPAEERRLGPYALAPETIPLNAATAS